MILKQAFNTIMQSEMIGKILQNEALVESILKAITSSLEARDTISARYEQMLKTVGLVTASQLAEVQDSLDIMAQEADALREQLENSSGHARKLRQRAEEAEQKLTLAQKEIQELKLKLEQTDKSNTAQKASKPAKVSSKTNVQASPQWSPTMTKKELIEVATSLGLKVSSKLKKTDLIDRLKKLG